MNMIWTMLTLTFVLLIVLIALLYFKSSGKKTTKKKMSPELSKIKSKIVDN